MKRSTRVRQALLTIALGLLAPLIAGGMIWLSTFFPAERPAFQAGQFVEFGFENFTVQPNTNDTSGLPAYTIRFNFTNESDLQNGFAELEDSVLTELNERQAVYNVEGVNARDTDTDPVYRFFFENITPEEYQNGTFSTAAQQYARLVDLQDLQGTTYSSTVDLTSGVRRIIVSGDRDLTRSDHGTAWNSMLSALPVDAGTAYTLSLRSGVGVSTGQFNSEETKALLVNMEPAWWSLFNRLSTTGELTLQTQQVQLTFYAEDFATTLQGTIVLTYPEGSTAAAVSQGFFGAVLPFQYPQGVTYTAYAVGSNVPLFAYEQ